MMSKWSKSLPVPPKGGFAIVSQPKVSNVQDFNELCVEELKITYSTRLMEECKPKGHNVGKVNISKRKKKSCNCCFLCV